MLLFALLVWQGAASSVAPPPTGEVGGLTARVHVGARANGVLAIGSTNPIRVTKLRNIYTVAPPTGAVIVGALYDRTMAVVSGYENIPIPYVAAQDDYHGFISKNAPLVPGPYIVRVTITYGGTVLQTDEPCIARRLP